MVRAYESPVLDLGDADLKRRIAAVERLATLNKPPNSFAPRKPARSKNCTGNNRACFAFERSLELVADLAKVYEDASDFLRRALRPGVFERVKVRPRRKGEAGPPMAADVEAELTVPIALVIGLNFVEQADAELEAIRDAVLNERKSGSM